jgi:hypothetical protein
MEPCEEEQLTLLSDEDNMLSKKFSTVDIRLPPNWIGSTLQGDAKQKFLEIRKLIDLYDVEAVSTENLLVILDAIEHIKGGSYQQAALVLCEVVNYLRSLLLGSDTEVTFRTVILLDCIVKNSGFVMHALIGRRKFMKTLSLVARRHLTSPFPEPRRVAVYTLDCLQAWGEAFYPRQQCYPYIYQTYLKLRTKYQIKFPRPDFDPTRVPIFLGPMTAAERSVADHISAANVTQNGSTNANEEEGEGSVRTSESDQTKGATCELRAALEASLQEIDLIDLNYHAPAPVTPTMPAAFTTASNPPMPMQPKPYLLEMEPQQSPVDRILSLFPPTSTPTAATSLQQQCDNSAYTTPLRISCWPTSPSTARTQIPVWTPPPATLNPFDAFEASNATPAVLGAAIAGSRTPTACPPHSKHEARGENAATAGAQWGLDGTPDLYSLSSTLTPPRTVHNAGDPTPAEPVTARKPFLAASLQQPALGSSCPAVPHTRREEESTHTSAVSWSLPDIGPPPAVPPPPPPQQPPAPPAQPAVLIPAAIATVPEPPRSGEKAPPPNASHLSDGTASPRETAAVKTAGVNQHAANAEKGPVIPKLAPPPPGPPRPASRIPVVAAESLSEAIQRAKAGLRSPSQGSNPTPTRGAPPGQEVEAPAALRFDPTAGWKPAAAQPRAAPKKTVAFTPPSSDPDAQIKYYGHQRVVVRKSSNGKT